jgi:hypothetical protein
LSSHVVHPPPWRCAESYTGHPVLLAACGDDTGHDHADFVMPAVVRASTP